MAETKQALFTVLRPSAWNGHSLIISNMGTRTEFLNPDHLSRRKGTELDWEEQGRLA